MDLVLVRCPSDHRHVESEMEWTRTIHSIKRNSLIYSRFFTVWVKTFIKIKKNNGWDANHHQLCLGIFL